MDNTKLKIGKLCVQHKHLIEPEELQAHIAEFPDHHYIEVEYNEVVVAEPTSAVVQEIDDHPNDTENPHHVTALQIGAATTVDIAQIHVMIAEGMATMLAHNNNTGNPHQVTPAQIGAVTPAQLSVHTSAQDNPHNVTSQQVGAIPVAEKGVANGVATLDAGGKIPASQIPASILPKFSVVQTIAERDALVAKEGDEAKVIADGSHWIYDGTQWYEYLTGNSVDAIYGSEFQKVLSPGVHVTTEYAYYGVSKTSFTTSVLPLGTYKIEVSYGWSHNDTSSDFIAFLNLDGVQLQQAHQQEPKDHGGSFWWTGTSQKHYTTRVYYVTDLSGAHTLDLRFRTEKRYKESSMWDASISIMRVE